MGRRPEGTEEARPSRLWERALAALLPEAQRDAALGDAAEEHARRAAADGSRAAAGWYRRQVLRSLLPAAVHGFRRLAAAAWAPSTGEGSMATTWRRDLGLAFRTLRRRPGFSLTVVAILAMGIGATTALFSVFRTVFLEPLPLPDSNELVVIMEQGSFGCCGPASGPDYLDWKERNRSFDGIAALDPGTFTLTGLETPERVYGTYVTASAFDFLGVAPAMGRALTPDDQDHPGAVVLSWQLWQDQLGGRSDILGSALEVDGTPYTVVGVMPKAFDVPSPWSQMGDQKLYLPFQSQRLQGNRGSHGFPVIARLSPGVTVEAAQHDMDRVMRELAAEYPASNTGRSTRISTVHDYLYGEAGKQLGLILGAAAVVLLIACGNVAALLLARAAARETELSVRVALGASRSAVARLLFSESLLLALGGGVVGVLVAMGAVSGLKALLPPNIPRVADVGVDGWALLFALGAVAFTSIVFGGLPSMLAARAGLAARVKEGGYQTLAPSRERVRDAFIVGQVALGLVLANGAALLMRSYAAVRGQEYGFHADGVLTVAMNPAGPRYQDAAAVERLYDQVSARVGALPGVAAVGTVTRLPLFGGSNGEVWVEGRPPRTHEGEGPLVEVVSVTGDYFDVMGIPLVEGRTLLPDDSLSAATGVVINQALAREAWPGEDPLGKRFSFSDSPPHWLTVVGVVGDVREWGPEQPAHGEAYFPFAQGWSTGTYLTLRTPGEPAALAPAVRRAVLEVDPTQPPSDVATMRSRVEGSFAQRRFYTTLIGLFAGAALLLAAAGVYGTISFFVARRVRELGVRRALGAAHRGIVALVVGRGLRLAVWGVALGLLGVWASTTVVKGLVYGVGAADAPTILVGCLTLALVAAAASLVPALRAVRVSPVLALRSE